MQRILTIFILFAVTLIFGCGPDPDPDGLSKFSYDEETGECKNSAGTIGFNEIDMEAIRASKDCECMKFSKIELLLLKGDTVQVPQRFGYEEIRNYNFKGAVLDSCQLFFNLIVASDLRGADLSTLQYGYAYVFGRRDEFTKPPLEGNVTLDGDTLRAYR